MPNEPLSKGKVFVLVYEHKHGTDVSVTATHGAALSIIADIAFNHWDDREDKTAPADPNGLEDQVLVDAYFGDRFDESFSIEEQEVAGIINELHAAEEPAPAPKV